MFLFGKKKFTEPELIAACAQNDRSAQEALFRQFFPEMLRMCLRSTRDEDTAIEIVNKGFLKVFQKIETFGAKGSLEGWIRRIVYHCMADHFRSEARYCHFLIFDEKDDSIAEQSLSRLYEEDILKAVRSLPHMSQEVFRQYAIEGFSHAEIAKNLSISEGTSKWHLSTARQQLRLKLEKMDGHLGLKPLDKLA